MYPLKRNKRKIYLCSKVEKNGRKIFSEPKEYMLNYQPLTTDGEVITAGTEYINRLAIYTDVKIAKEFHNADRCYVYVSKPENYDKYCSTADFYVDGEPLIFLNESHFYLQRMVGEEDA